MLRKITSRILLTGARAFPKEISPVSINLEAASRLRRGFSDNPVYNTIPQVTVDTCYCHPPCRSLFQVFDRIKHVANSDVVKEIGAVFHFKVNNDKSYVVDLKNGEGSVVTGDPSDKPDVTITMDPDNLLKMFNRELQPATAFMTGKLTVKGDLSKALTLEKVMKAAREAGK